MRNVERVMNTNKFDIARKSFIKENFDHFATLTLQMVFKARVVK